MNPSLRGAASKREFTSQGKCFPGTTNTEKIKQHITLAIISKTKVDVEDLLPEKPKEFVTPGKPMEKPEHVNPTKQSTRERQVKNFALINKWEHDCPRIRAIGVTINKTPWKVVEEKVESNIFLSLAKEGRRKLQRKYANV